MIPIVLELFGCRDSGVQKPVDAPPEFDPHTFADEPGSWFDSNGMPLISASLPEMETFSNRIKRFRAEEGKLSFQPLNVTSRSLPNSAGAVSFLEYLITHSSTTKLDVYALTSGYLHLLNGSKSYSKVLGGAVPNAGEEILVLKTLPRTIGSWSMFQPGRGAILGESAYFNMEMDDAALLTQIQKSTTAKFHRAKYQEKMGVEWSGSPDQWPAAYLDLFKQFPDVPIIVQGGAKLGSTSVNTPSGQRLSINFMMGERWAGHEAEVQEFFKNHQRNYGLTGHPLVAKLLGRSVREATVDVVPVENDLAKGNPALRRKSKLATDFTRLAGSVDPEYHPLALDLDQSPNPFLMVPKAPTGDVPPFLATLVEQHPWATKLKISNPMAQSITIDGFDPTEMRVTRLTGATALEPIFEVKAEEQAPADRSVRVIHVKANGKIVHSLGVVFFDFKSVPIKFLKLINKDAAEKVLHQAELDEGKLEETVVYANEILGRQANVYLYPIEETGIRLHELIFHGDLGDPIVMGNSTTKGVKNIYDACLPPQPESARVVFVWDQEVGESLGVTYFPGGSRWGVILIDTLVVPAVRSLPATPRTVPQMAKTLVHELGHWFSNTFIRIKLESPPCANGIEHFNHYTNVPGVKSAGCSGGDWSFYGNVMDAGELSLEITFDQATVFCDHAGDVVS